jgi:hypothetical protein
MSDRLVLGFVTDTIWYPTTKPSFVVETGKQEIKLRILLLYHLGLTGTGEAENSRLENLQKIEADRRRNEAESFQHRTVSRCPARYSAALDRRGFCYRVVADR